MEFLESLGDFNDPTLVVDDISESPRFLIEDYDDVYDASRLS